MFYSEAILSKKGPLARVWLAAHWEKKLTKSNIMQTDIQTAAREISEENHAPMALRLSGQLLLGVVRIYSRKARYLLEDCNDALMKIKMTFRPGNVDMSTIMVKTTQAQANQLILPDTLTELDLLMPEHNFELDLDLDLNATFARATQAGPTEPSFTRSVELGRGMGGGLLELEEEDEDAPILGPSGTLDLGLDLDLGDRTEEPSVELGRDAAPARDLEDEFDVTEVQMKDLDDTILAATPTRPEGPGEMSMLPEIGLDFDEPMPDIDAPEDSPAAAAAAPQRSLAAPRKRRILEDAVTELSTRALSASQRDTSAITKRPRLLPSDPRLLSLMQGSLGGTLGTDIFAPSNLNPAIRALLAPEFVQAVTQRYEERLAQDAPLADEASLAAQLEDDTELPTMPEMELDLGDFGGPQPVEAADELTGAVADEVGQVAAIDAAAPEDTGIPAPVQAMASTVTATDARQAVETIQAKLQEGGKASFGQLSRGAPRVVASELFFQCLSLATRGAIHVAQADPYGEIQLEGREKLSHLSQILTQA